MRLRYDTPGVGREDGGRGGGPGRGSYLGTPGGIRAGREGIRGGALKGSRLLLLKAFMGGGPGREGMGGAPNAGEGFKGGPGVWPRTPGGRLGGGAAAAGLR